MKQLLITGGTGDLGSAVVPLLVTSYRCAVLYRRAEEWKKLQEAIGSDRLTGFAADLTDEKSVSSAVAAAAGEGGSFHGLVHLAGGFEPGSIEETPLERWNGQLALNATGAFLVSRAAIPHLSRGGRIIMISSALTQHVTRGAGAYAVSKAALNTLVDVLAVELKDRQITVNAILPTTLDTPANRGGGDIGKLIPLDRVAGTIAFLLSEEASHITGSRLVLSR